MSHHHSDIDRLISLYLSNLASESEKQELEEWVQTSAANKEVFEWIKEIWSSTPDVQLSPDMEQVRDRIWTTGTVQTPKATSRRRSIDIVYWSKIAAIFILFLIGAGLFSYLVKDTHNTIFSETVALVKIENPSGKRSVHTLPDGTKVWLNAASSLSYPEKFNDTLRLTHLTGEAFFKVAEDKQRPFVVEAASTRTQALGTAFNIHSYSEDDTVKIALLEGKVSVQSVDLVQIAILSPGELLFAPKDNTGFYSEQFNYENIFGWKDGILIFEGVDFAEFRTAIERWYGVEVESIGNIPDDWHIRAKYQNENLRHVLRDICFNKNIPFEIHGKKVLITF